MDEEGRDPREDWGGSRGPGQEGRGRSRGEAGERRGGSLVVEKRPRAEGQCQEGVGRDGAREEGRRSLLKGAARPGQHVLTHPHACDFPCFLGILILFSGKLPVP